MAKFFMEVTPEFIKVADGKWLPCEGLKLDFHPDGSVNLTITDNIHNARLTDNFWEPNGGKEISYPSQAYN